MGGRDGESDKWVLSSTNGGESEGGGSEKSGR